MFDDLSGLVDICFAQGGNRYFYGSSNSVCQFFRQIFQFFQVSMITLSVWDYLAPSPFMPSATSPASLAKSSCNIILSALNLGHLKYAFRLPHLDHLSYQEECGVVGDPGSLLHVVGHDHLSVIVLEALH